MLVSLASLFAVVPGPGYGSTLADRVDRDMVRAALETQVSARKASGARRRRIYCDDYDADLRKRVSDTHYNPQFVRRLHRHVAPTVNPLRDIANVVPCVYRRGVRRVLQGATPAEQETYLGLMDTTGIDTLAPT
jgi:hypothetical protein